MYYRDFLSSALAEGLYIAGPEPSVAGKSVHSFHRAMDIQLKGVSAAKVVVTSPRNQPSSRRSAARFQPLSSCRAIIMGWTWLAPS